MEPKENGIPHGGLSSDEAAKRAAAGQKNVSDEKAGKSYLRIVTDNLFTFFNLVWAIIAVLMILCKSYSNLTFLAVIIPNVLIAIVQECRAKRTVEHLSVTTDPKTTVLRDGVLSGIDASEVVLGDTVYLEMGMQVPADCTVTEGVCEVNESMLTGESDAIRKSEGDRLLAGSYLVGGAAYAEVYAVGKDNYVAKIEKAAKGFRAPASNLFRDLNKLLRIISFVMVPTALLYFLLHYVLLRTSDLSGAVIAASGAVIGMIPAGMYLLVTVTLTLSVIELSAKKTLVRDMYSIEMLASADVVCLDKTGTVTDGTMSVTDVCPLGETDEEGICRIMALLEGTEKSINPTSKALIDRFGTDTSDTVTDKIPFSSKRKFTTATFASAGTFSVGAPHFVDCPVSAEAEERIASLAAEGKRVLILASHKAPGVTGEGIALIAIADRIRPNAKETIEKFQASDVCVKIISGDHPATVSAIAGRVGVKGYEKYVNCDGLSDEELAAKAEEYTVFGRVSPEQKVLLVRTLKAHGHTVAMTGDGVNDTLALKESNCAIAMAEGSEVARKVSQIVLMESDFGTLPDVVREGRRCINNVRRSASLFLMKTFLTMSISVFTVLTGLLALIPALGVTAFEYPFPPKGLVLLELFVIGLSSVLLALEPNEERIRGSFIRTVLTNSLSSGIALLVPVAAVLVLGAAGVFDTTPLRNAMALIAVLCAGLTNLITLCIPYTKWRVLVSLSMTAALALAIPVSVFLVNDMFDLTPVAGHAGAVLCVALGSAVFSLLTYLVARAVRARRSDRRA